MGLSITPRQFLQRPTPFSRYLAPLGAKYVKKDKKHMKEKLNLRAVIKSAASAASPEGFWSC